jgi:hypothetical protein
MNLSINKNRVITLIFATAALLTGCGSGEKLVSSWPDKQIQIDGKSGDWEGALTTFAKEQYSVGFKNDSKYLYVCFITSDREKINRIMFSGLNVLFHSPEDERRDYSITFPVPNPEGMREMMGNQMKPGDGIQAQQRDGEEQVQMRTPPYQQILDRQLNFNLIEKDYTNSISLKNNENIELKMGASNEILVYELKVPLANTKSSFPVSAAPGDKVEIKIDIPQNRITPKGRQGSNEGEMRVDTENPREGAEGNMPPGTMRGGRGGMRGGRMMPNARANDNFPVNFVVTLTKEK